MYDITEKVQMCIYDEDGKNRGEVLGRNNIKDNIYWYRLCDDGKQETIISERANIKESAGEETEDRQSECPGECLWLISNQFQRR